VSGPTCETCPAFDPKPPAWVKVLAGCGICRAQQPGKHTDYRTGATYPTWPSVMPLIDWCLSHPERARAWREATNQDQDR
jgi:hypothetical protein